MSQQRFDSVASRSATTASIRALVCAGVLCAAAVAIERSVRVFIILANACYDLFADSQTLHQARRVPVYTILNLWLPLNLEGFQLVGLAIHFRLVLVATPSASFNFSSFALVPDSCAYIYSVNRRLTLPSYIVTLLTLCYLMSTVVPLSASYQYYCRLK